MEDLTVEDLLDDINTDAMTPAWVCFDHRPEDIARNAYAGLIVDGKRLCSERDALHQRQLRGHRLRLPQGRRQLARDRGAGREVVSGIRIAIAASFAPIHARNNINQGLLMGDHDMLAAPAGRRGHPARASSTRATTRSRSSIIQRGGLFPFSKAVAARRDASCPCRTTAPRPMTMAEKILARHMLGVATTSAT